MEDYPDYIRKQYLYPYFLSGVKKYIERGDNFLIEDTEFFILESEPENGFINEETNILLKFGLTKERCLDKIKNADRRFVMSLMEQEESHSDPILDSREGGFDELESEREEYFI